MYNFYIILLLSLSSRAKRGISSIYLRGIAWRSLALLGMTAWGMATLHAASHHPEAFLLSIKDSPNKGQAIYEHFCAQCHSPKPPVAVGAPTIGDKDAWQKALKQDTSLLWQHVDEGVGVMPPRGGCFECDDQELISAIVYLAPKNEQNALCKLLKDNKKRK